MVDFFLGLFFGKLGIGFMLMFKVFLGCVLLFLGYLISEVVYFFLILFFFKIFLFLGRGGEGREKLGKLGGMREGFIRWMWNFCWIDKIEVIGLECEK